MASCLRLHSTTMLYSKDSAHFRGFRASILDFRPRIGNRCIDSGDLLGFRASILDFKPRLGNRCTESGDFRGFRAVILDFRSKLANQCTDSGDLLGFRAVILDFRPRIENHRSNGGLQAKLIFVAATKIRVGRGISQQRRTAGETNLRRRNEDQSRTRNIAATAAKGEIFR